ncbi:MAG: triose-phosphate isomerase [Alphaproteobacteria bacterium]|nr:triose-phosphate isomerase [Alphaproteobacteria bacterium]
MATKRVMLVAGNWKMNGLAAEGHALAQAVAAGAEGVGCELLVCPPAVLLSTAGAALSGSGVALGGQDCHPEESGAHTGDLSAEMLADAGSRFVIVGHSERRADHGESDALVRAKALAAHRAGLTTVICVGETEVERDAGRADAVVAGQIKGSLPEKATAADTVIAYEPVWAIGTGRTPTPDEVQAMHRHMRAIVSGSHGAEIARQIRLLYGGSVKPGNASELMALEDVDGALVGGASLVAADFLAIAGCCA